MKICDYGCGQLAKYQFKNGKWCCNKIVNSCPKNIIKRTSCLKGRKVIFSIEHKKNISKGRKGISPWNKNLKNIYSEKTLKLMSDSKKETEPWNKGLKNIYSDEVIDKLKKAPKLTIKKLLKRYSLFSKIEEMRYNPGNPYEKEIQVHCKNHNCENSKEEGGWFTPTYIQLYERIRQIEKEYGNGGSYFYCSDKCKEECSLYNLHSDPFKNNEIPYTQKEYQIWKSVVLEQYNYNCQICGSKENLHCHHIIPIKLESIFSLDPDNGIVLCEKCHYKYGHKTGSDCSTRKLANKFCLELKGDKINE